MNLIEYEYKTLLETCKDYNGDLKLFNSYYFVKKN